MREPDGREDLARLKTEIARALSQAIAPYVEALHAVEDVRSQIREWLRKHRTELEAVGHYLQKLSKLDWRDLDRPVHEAELRLAEAGWTIADWMYSPAVMSISGKTDAEIDSFMTA